MTHEVELLWFEDCANHTAARSILEEVIAEVAPGTPFHDVDATDPAIAAWLRFPGSPTIRVDGVDVDPAYVDPGDYTPRCRLYRTSAGLHGLPERRWIEDALRSTARGRPVLTGSSGAMAMTADEARTGDGSVTTSAWVAGHRRVTRSRDGLGRHHPGWRRKWLKMNIFGDIERLLALLYPYRLPLAVLGVIALISLGIAARRRSWDRVARRHPRAMIVILAAVLVVGAPVTWVLGSPLLIRTELVEATTVTSGTTTLIGTFTGADEFHTGSGTAQIVEAEPGRFVLRLEQFSVRNGPDLFVYLSSEPTGYENGAIELGPLKASDGSFEYQIPAGTEIAHIRSAVIWCRAFSVQFSVAPLSAA